MRDAIAVLLTDQDVASQVGSALREVAQHLVEQFSGSEDVAAGLLEEIEELTVTGG